MRPCIFIVVLGLSLQAVASLALSLSSNWTTYSARYCDTNLGYACKENTELTMSQPSPDTWIVHAPNTMANGDSPFVSSFGLRSVIDLSDSTETAIALQNRVFFNANVRTIPNWKHHKNKNHIVYIASWPDSIDSQMTSDLSHVFDSDNGIWDLNIALQPWGQFRQVGARDESAGQVPPLQNALFEVRLQPNSTRVHVYVYSDDTWASAAFNELQVSDPKVFVLQHPFVQDGSQFSTCHHGLVKSVSVADGQVCLSQCDMDDSCMAAQFSSYQSLQCDLFCTRSFAFCSANGYTTGSLTGRVLSTRLSEYATDPRAASDDNPYCFIKQWPPATDSWQDQQCNVDFFDWCAFRQ